MKDLNNKFFQLTFEKAIRDSLSANIAVLDPHGEILSVNLSWEKFAEANQMQDVTMGIGANYLAVCRSARADPNARAALRGILDVIKGRRTSFYHEYPATVRVSNGGLLLERRSLSTIQILLLCLTKILLSASTPCSRLKNNESRWRCEHPQPG